MGGTVSSGWQTSDWEEIGWINVDAATVAFGDPVILGEGFVLSPTVDVVGGSPEGFRGTIVMQDTREDCPLPVEVVRGSDGNAVAARMCFTDDVDDLPGTWKPMAEFTITDGRCVALDPHCRGPSYRFEFTLRPGRYLAESFEYVDPEDGQQDVLGLLIILNPKSSG